MWPLWLKSCLEEIMQVQVAVQIIRIDTEMTNTCSYCVFFWGLYILMEEPLYWGNTGIIFHVEVCFIIYLAVPKTHPLREAGSEREKLSSELSQTYPLSWPEWGTHQEDTDLGQQWWGNGGWACHSWTWLLPCPSQIGRRTFFHIETLSREKRKCGANAFGRKL